MDLLAYRCDSCHKPVFKGDISFSSDNGEWLLFCNMDCMNSYILVIARVEQAISDTKKEE